jgi:hypothetical protein
MLFQSPHHLPAPAGWLPDRQVHVDIATVGGFIMVSLYPVASGAALSDQFDLSSTYSRMVSCN